MFEFKELTPILRFSSFLSIRTNRYIVTIAGNSNLAPQEHRNKPLDENEKYITKGLL